MYLYLAACNVRPAENVREGGWSSVVKAHFKCGGADTVAALVRHQG